MSIPDENYDLVITTLMKYSRGIRHRGYESATLTAINRWELYLDIRDCKRKIAAYETMQQV